MKHIPLRAIERQSFSIPLEGSLYDIAIKECNGIMAISIYRNQEPIIGFRRVCSGVPLIPIVIPDMGNFIFTSSNGEIPYFNKFESTDQLYYVTTSELIELGVM